MCIEFGTVLGGTDLLNFDVLSYSKLAETATED
jgi:hypothetical protein